MKKLALCLMIILLCGFTVASAVEDDLFQAITLEKNATCDAITITLNDALSVSIPEHWTEVPQEEENTCCYQYQDESVEITVYAGWMVIPEGVTYAYMQENLQAMSTVICNANKNGFEWCAANMDDGIAVIHAGEDGCCYALLFIIDIKNDAAYERVVHDCGYILDSFNRLGAVVKVEETEVYQEEHSFFNDLFPMKDWSCPSETIVLNDELVLSLPEQWMEMPQDEEKTLCYQYQDEEVDITLSVQWDHVPEFSYAELQERVRGYSNAVCTVDKAGFKWVAGDVGENEIVIAHYSESKYGYVLVLKVEIKNDAAYEHTVNVCSYILHSFDKLQKDGDDHVAE